MPVLMGAWICFLFAATVPERIRSMRQERLSSLRPLGEFFDHQRISRPQDTNEAFQRITYNTRHFSGNYAVIVALLTVYGMINDTLLLFAILFLVLGFWAINRFAPEPMQVGEHVITQKSLYTGLFVIGIPLLWFASPFGFMFWLVGSSAFLILGHAAFIEPPVSSEYTGVEVSSALLHPHTRAFVQQNLADLSLFVRHRVCCLHLQTV